MAVVHARRLVVPSNRPSSPPFFQASSYEFSDLDDVEAVYASDRAGRIYGRYGGPNGAQFEAAIATTVGSGNAIVATREVYGGTYALLEHEYRGRGVDVRYVD